MRSGVLVGLRPVVFDHDPEPDQSHDRRRVIHFGVCGACPQCCSSRTHLSGFGALPGIAAQAFLAIVVIFHVLPWFGLELLDTARAVAEFDLPMRVMRLFWGAT